MGKGGEGLAESIISKPFPRVFELRDRCCVLSISVKVEDSLKLWVRFLLFFGRRIDVGNTSKFVLGFASDLDKSKDFHVERI